MSDQGTPDGTAPLTDLLEAASEGNVEGLAQLFEEFV